MTAPESSSAIPAGAPGRTCPSKGVTLIIRGPVAREGIPSLCDRAQTLLVNERAQFLVCDVGNVTIPDATVVDALTRLQLTAQRLGCRMGVAHASSDLRELLAFVGLADVVKEIG